MFAEGLKHKGNKRFVFSVEKCIAMGENPRPKFGGTKVCFIFYHLIQLLIWQHFIVHLIEFLIRCSRLNYDVFALILLQL